MNKFDKQHLIYERQFFQRLIKFFRDVANQISLGLITEENAELLITSAFGKEALKKIMYSYQLSIGNSYGKKVGTQLNKAFGKNGFKYPLFSEKFQGDLIDYYDKFGGKKIVILQETYVKEVVKEIRKSTLLNETVIQMRDRIYLTVNKPDFYKWQALRIARTETTFAMNSSKQLVGEVSGFVMEKVWSAKLDSRVRHTHGDMDKKAVEQNAFFDVGNVRLRFPGDEFGEGSRQDIAKEVINCRCSYGYRGKRGDDGKLIYVDI